MQLVISGTCTLEAKKEKKKKKKRFSALRFLILKVYTEMLSACLLSPFTWANALVHRYTIVVNV